MNNIWFKLKYLLRYVYMPSREYIEKSYLNRLLTERKYKNTDITYLSNKYDELNGSNWSCPIPTRNYQEDTPLATTVKFVSKLQNLVEASVVGISEDRIYFKVNGDSIDKCREIANWFGMYR